MAFCSSGNLWRLVSPWPDQFLIGLRFELDIKVQNIVSAAEGTKARTCHRKHGGTCVETSMCCQLLAPKYTCVPACVGVKLGMQVPRRSSWWSLRACSFNIRVAIL